MKILILINLLLIKALAEKSINLKINADPNNIIDFQIKKAIFEELKKSNDIYINYQKPNICFLIIDEINKTELLKLNTNNKIIIILHKNRLIFSYDNNYKRFFNTKEIKLIIDENQYLLDNDLDGYALLNSIKKINKILIDNQDSSLFWYFISFTLLIILCFFRNKNKKYKFFIKSPLDTKINKLIKIGKKVKSGQFVCSESCPICLENMDNISYVSVTNCDHIFHNKCLNEWRSKNNNCPLCRKNICMERELPKNAELKNKLNYYYFKNSFSNFTDILDDSEVKHLKTKWNKEISRLFEDNYLNEMGLVK